jgi:hypothetical protein
LRTRTFTDDGGTVVVVVVERVVDVVGAERELPGSVVVVVVVLVEVDPVATDAAWGASVRARTSTVTKTATSSTIAALKGWMVPGGRPPA